MKKRKGVHRKIYEQHYGSIPVDETGRTYDIHHIDGDKTNDDPSNLIALSIDEHYKVHYDKGEYHSQSEEHKIMAKKTVERLIREGKHTSQQKKSCPVCNRLLSINGYGSHLKTHNGDLR